MSVRPKSSGNSDKKYAPNSPANSHKSQAFVANAVPWAAWSRFLSSSHGKPSGYCLERIGRGPGNFLYKWRALLYVEHGGVAMMQKGLMSLIF